MPQDHKHMHGVFILRQYVSAHF